MKKTLFLFLILFLTSCATGGQTAFGGGKKTGGNPSETVVESSQIHEDCFELQPAQVLSYSFTSSKPLDFNIHYHETEPAHKIFYGVRKDHISSDKGDYKAEKLQYYCLMWTNPGSDTVKLSYEYAVK